MPKHLLYMGHNTRPLRIQGGLPWHDNRVRLADRYQQIGGLTHSRYTHNDLYSL